MLARIHEDWWSVILGFLLILLSYVGILGKASGWIKIPW